MLYEWVGFLFYCVFLPINCVCFISFIWFTFTYLAFGKQVAELPQIQPKDDEELTYVYQGTCLLKCSPKSTMDDMKTFQVRDDDLYLISYPKCGKT